MSTADVTRPVRPPVDDFIPRRKLRLTTLLLGVFAALAVMAGGPSQLPGLPVVKPVLHLIAPASADAHISYYNAYTLARRDCGRAYDWICFKFPTHEDKLWPYTIYYQEARPFWASPIYQYKRSCYTYWLSGYYNEHRKLCGPSY